MKGGFSIKLPDNKSPEEVREYLKVCQDAAMKTVKSCDIEPAPIPEGNKPAQLPASPSGFKYKKNGRSKPVSEKQLMTAYRICKDKGLSPETIAAEYGATKLEDVSGGDMWKFINENIQNKVEGEF